MAKINDAVKRQCKEAYEKGCNTYLLALLNAWELDGHYGYWIGDEIGGVYSYGESIFINMEDIVFCVENDIDENEYMEWQEYNVEANEFGFDFINLKSWHMGCPRVTRETFDRLRKMKQTMMDEVEKEKELLKNKKS